MKQQTSTTGFFVLLACFPIRVSGADIDITRERRIDGIVAATTGATSIATW